MWWGNKSPNTKAEGSFWEQCRAPPASGHAKIRVICTYTCRSSRVVLRTLSTGRKSRYCFSFRWGKSSTVKWSGFPRSPRDTDRNIAASVTPALSTSHMLLHPESKRKRCIPTRINNPSAKLLKSFTCVTVAARSSSRWAEQHCAKCSSNTKHKKPCNLRIFISTRVRQASPSQEICSVIDQLNEKTSLDQTPVKYENMYCRKNSVSKT